MFANDLAATDTECSSSELFIAVTIEESVLGKWSHVTLNVPNNRE